MPENNTSLYPSTISGMIARKQMMEETSNNTKAILGNSTLVASSIKSVSNDVMETNKSMTVFGKTISNTFRDLKDLFKRKETETNEETQKQYEYGDSFRKDVSNYLKDKGKSAIDKSAEFDNEIGLAVSGFKKLKSTITDINDYRKLRRDKREERLAQQPIEPEVVLNPEVGTFTQQPEFVDAEVVGGFSPEQREADLRDRQQERDELFQERTLAITQYEQEADGDRDMMIELLEDIKEKEDKKSFDPRLLGRLAGIAGMVTATGVALSKIKDLVEVTGEVFKTGREVAETNTKLIEMQDKTRLAALERGAITQEDVELLDVAQSEQESSLQVFLNRLDDITGASAFGNVLGIDRNLFGSGARQASDLTLEAQSFITRLRQLDENIDLSSLKGLPAEELITSLQARELAKAKPEELRTIQTKGFEDEFVEKLGEIIGRLVNPMNQMVEEQKKTNSNMTKSNSSVQPSQASRK